MADAAQRYVAFDLHKRQVTVAAVDQAKAVVLAPRQVALSRLEKWCHQHLRSQDQVVMEAGPNTWHAYDIVEPVVSLVVVADPRKLRAMAAGAPKTDARDAIFPATLLAAEMVPEIWVPPKDVRDLRTLIHYRQRLVRRSTAARNRLHALMARRHVAVPDGDPFAQSCRAWWETLDLRPTEALLACQDLDTLDATTDQRRAVDAHLARLSVSEPWHADANLMLHRPGFAVVNAMTLLSAVGTIHRFPRSSHLVAYGGLDPRVYQSGETLRAGRISKRGRRELRSVMVQAAWVAVTCDEYWKARFAHLQAKLGTPKAIVAIARKLLVLVWRVLTHREVADRSDPETVARKYLRWATEHRLATSLHLSRTEFVRLELKRLRIKHGPINIKSGGWNLRLEATTAG